MRIILENDWIIKYLIIHCLFKLLFSEQKKIKLNRLISRDTQTNNQLFL